LDHLRGYNGRGVMLTSYPLLVPGSIECRAIILPPPLICAFESVTGYLKLTQRSTLGKPRHILIDLAGRRTLQPDNKSQSETRRFCRRDPVAALIYRVIQEESAILWEMIVCVILSKKFQMNMGPILIDYRDYGKKKIRTVLRARTAIT
jgi:hypothetical protein